MYSIMLSANSEYLTFSGLIAVTKISGTILSESGK